MDSKSQPVSGYLQTIAHNNVNEDQDILINHPSEDHAVQFREDEASETADILFKYQQHYNERKKTKSPTKSPTKRRRLNSSLQPTSCFRESLPLLCAWFGYFFHMTVALMPDDMFWGTIDTDGFYEKYKIDISPAPWMVIQFGIQILWQGILLTYLSLIVAEHTFAILSNAFYYGLAIANISLAIWCICTYHESFIGRAISWLCVAICLTWSNYLLLRHVYHTYDVTNCQLPSRFRLGHMLYDHESERKNELNEDDYIPPYVGNTDKTTAHNINAILRIQTGGSVNSSPLSMSMAPSAAQKFVYDAALAAADDMGDEEWFDARIKDITRVKYSGLIGLVFNGTSFFLSVVVIDFWVQVGVWLEYECDTSDNVASLVTLSMMFVTILIYYCCDFYYFSKYFVDNFATHIVFCMAFAAMVSKHVFGKAKHEARSIAETLQMIGFCIVVVVGIVKTIKTVRVHRKYKNELMNLIKDEYKRVI